MNIIWSGKAINVKHSCNVYVGPEGIGACEYVYINEIGESVPFRNCPIPPESFDAVMAYIIKTQSKKCVLVAEVLPLKEVK